MLYAPPKTGKTGFSGPASPRIPNTTGDHAEASSLNSSSAHGSSSGSSSRQTYRRRVVYGTDPLDFVKHVWGFEPRDLPASQRAVVSKNILESYLSSSSAPTKPGEPNSADVMHRLLCSIRCQISADKASLPSGGFRRSAAIDRRGKKMPSIIFSPNEGDDWSMIGTFIDVIRDKSVGFCVPENDVNVRVRSESQRPRLQHSAKHSLWQQPSFHLSRLPHRIDMVGTPLQKVSVPIYEPDPLPFSEEEAAVAAHITSMLCGGIRQYASGIAVRNTTVSLYYGDRLGLVMSSEFDLIKDARTLVIVVAAISRAHSTSLGFSPYLYLPKDPQSTGVSLDGTKVKFSMAYDVQGQAIGPWRFFINITKDRGVFIASEPLGRGTTVVPIRKDGSSTELVWKTAFPQAHLENEGEVIEKITASLRKHKAEALKHVVELICSFSGNIREAGLPRVFLGEAEGVGPRVFRSMVMVAYRPMAELQTAADFKQVFVDAVKAHHWVWKYADILHRDISDNNVMYYVDGGKIVGVLCDFDMACYKKTIDVQLRREASIITRIRKGHKHRPLSFAGNWTGTVQFLSCELLATNYAPVQTYRHDLESFLYLLVSHCATHDRKNRTYGYFQQWNRGDDVKIGEAKARFLSKQQPWDVENLFKEYFHKADEEYQDIISTWVKPLRELFHCAGENFWYGCEDHWRSHLKRFYPTGRKITFARFMEAIGEDACDCCEASDSDDDDDDEYACLSSDESDEESSDAEDDEDDDDDDEDSGEDEDMDVDEGDDDSEEDGSGDDDSEVEI